MTLAGIKMRVVGEDATPMARPRWHGHQLLTTSTISIGAGESVDAIFTAPAVLGAPGRMTPTCSTTATTRGRTTWRPAASAGRCTEVRVYPAGTRAGRSSIPTTGYVADCARATKGDRHVVFEDFKWMRLRHWLLAGLGWRCSAGRWPCVNRLRRRQRPADGHRLHHRRQHRQPSRWTPRPATSACPTATPCTCGATRSGGDALPASRPGAVRQRGRHGHGHPAQHLPEDVSIIFPGQENVLANGAPAQPQFDGWTTLTSLTNVAAANGGSVTYSFVATHPGTFLYECGTEPGEAGAHGPVRRADRAPDGGRRTSPTTTRPTASSRPSRRVPGAALGDRSVPAPGGREAARAFNLNNYHPRYWLINGRGFPDTHRRQLRFLAARASPTARWPHPSIQ